MRLHLGVRHENFPEPNGVPTGDVAEILENKYGLFSNFYWNNRDFIAEQLHDCIARAIEIEATGGTTPSNIFQSGEEQISKRFRDFITLSEIEGLGIPGVPTKAALEGRTSRTKGKRGPRRPSFKDSGILRGELYVWVEQ